MMASCIVIHNTNHQATYIVHAVINVFIVAGKVVSQKKDELNHILDQFNIQVNCKLTIISNQLFSSC